MSASPSVFLSLPSVSPSACPSASPQCAPQALSMPLSVSLSLFLSLCSTGRPQPHPHLDALSGTRVLSFQRTLWPRRPRHLLSCHRWYNLTFGDEALHGAMGGEAHGWDPSNKVPGDPKRTMAQLSPAGRGSSSPNGVLSPVFPGTFPARTGSTLALKGQTGGRGRGGPSNGQGGNRGEGLRSELHPGQAEGSPRLLREPGSGEAPNGGN